MLIESFLKHVEDTTEFGDVPPNKKLEIAVMGLVSEIGSVVSAVKKGMLHENGPLGSDSVKAELKAELDTATEVEATATTTATTAEEKLRVLTERSDAFDNAQTAS